MRITRLRIENFRSIHELEMYPQGLCALVGENSAGKSNILKAIDFVLGPRWPQITSLERTDFYRCDENNAIRIEIDIEAQGTTHGVIFGVLPDNRGNQDYRLQIDGRIFVKREEREQFPVLLLGIDRSLSGHLAYNRWTLLGRILQRINDKFRSDPTNEERFKEEIKRVRGVLESPSDFSQLVRILKEEGAKQLRKKPEDFSVDLEMYDPWNFYRTFQILVTDDDLTFQAGDMGMGVQSSLTIAIIRAYANLMHDEAILAIEEPEIFLHPQAQRNFYRILRGIAEKGGQVFYSTHSSLLVAVAYFDEVCVIRREGKQGEKGTNATQVFASSFVEDLKTRYPGATPSEESIRERYGHAYNVGRNEGFFASKVILVEGEAEEYAFPIYLREVGLDIDREGISVIQAGGKQNLDRLLRLYNEFRIPVYIVFDGDKGKDNDGTSRKATKEIFSLLGLAGEPDYPSTKVAESHTIFEVDFETEMARRIPNYDELDSDAQTFFGIKDNKSGRGLRAAYIADRASKAPQVQKLFKQIKEMVERLQWHGTMLAKQSEDDIPF